MHFSEDSELSCLVCWAPISQHMWTCACVLFGQIPLIINAFHYSNEAILLSLKRPCPRCQTRPTVTNPVGSSSWITARGWGRCPQLKHTRCHMAEAHPCVHTCVRACFDCQVDKMKWMQSSDCKACVKLDLTWCKCSSLYKVNLWSATWRFFFLNGKKNK